MKRVLFITVLLCGLAPGVRAQTAPAAGELKKLLEEFLAGASRNDAAMHDRFWAEDVVYTGSSGRRVGKADILRDVRSAPAPKPGDPKTTYSAADIRVRQYGATAVVAFRLVGTTDRAGRTDVSSYLNTGTFAKRNGRWQAVAWQATRIPPSAEDAGKDVTAVQDAFHRALLAGDLETLAAVLDDGFIWTDGAGERRPRQQLLDQIAAGKLKYSKMETSDVAVSVHGETAIVRGAAPPTGFYTMTLVRKDGAWKAVALHTSRP
jgi:ketosteroid isomerase-like protein